MKIKIKKMSFDKVNSLKRPKHFNPIKPNIFFRTLLKLVSLPDMIATKFTYTKTDMEKAGNGPWLILMNHSSFVDLEIVHTMLYPKPINLIATVDAFVGKAWLMKMIGCVPTQKYVNDLTLLNDMEYSLKTKNTSVVMFPEAGYSLDGCSTRLPALGRLLKKLDVPVVYIQTKGAFSRDPLYNCLQRRKVKVSADMKCILSLDDVRNMSVQELDEIIDSAFTFDSFKWQKDNNIEINENFRADGLERMLYKCASCHTEGQMVGKGTTLKCNHCQKEYELDKYGQLKALNGTTEFAHIPDWYSWERECVKKEIQDGEYKLDIEVDIGVMVDYKALYTVGDGRLTHDKTGFKLVSNDGLIDYSQKPLVSHSINVDYYWYEIGDIISFGNRDLLYYCFPKNEEKVVTKTRLAAEEMYSIIRPKRQSKPKEEAKI